MPVIYEQDTCTFRLTTQNTLYIFRLYDKKYPVNLYYGANSPDAAPLFFHRYRSFSPYYPDAPGENIPKDAYGTNFSFDVDRMELPCFGTGDFRTDAMRIRGKDGNAATLFSYRSHRIFSGREPIPGLPYATPDEETETLELSMEDAVTGCILHIRYVIFPREDIIARSFVLKNEGDAPVQLLRGMSLSLDLPQSDFDLLSLPGTYGMERIAQRHPLAPGTHILSSRRGSSSHMMNPFFALSAHRAREESGDVYGFHFVYSGDFQDLIEVDQNGFTRIQVGINPDTFSWHLCPGESFSSPEALMTYTARGIGQMSRNFHAFVRHHLLRQTKTEHRPVVLNTWEGNFFQIDEQRMLAFAKEAVACGIDMLVMDDGWFGKRVNDRTGLGDWTENRDRFPDGLRQFVARVKQYPIKFGIWIEPEMVNPDSDLYRAHPDWVLSCPGRIRSHSRHQLVLDMSNPKVIKYLKSTFAATFDGVGIDYFKWDMNRHLTEVGSPIWQAERQCEVSHRYMLGVYELFSWFCNHFPNAMIENCSGGGGRYDLGMAPFCTQIWASDNTDPIDRTKIQHGSLLAYPASMLSCHVSNRENSCEDARRMEYRYRVALGGALGYEFDPTAISESAKRTIRAQIAEYRRLETCILQGNYYRLLSPVENIGVHSGKSAIDAHYTISPDGNLIYLVFLQNAGENPKTYRLRIPSAQENTLYRDFRTGETFSGETLRAGIAVLSDENGEYCRTWALEKLPSR